MTRSRVIGAGLIAGALALATACGASGSSDSGGGGGSAGNGGKPYNLLVVLPLSGAYAAPGAGAKAAIGIAVRQVNSSGGMDGRRVNATYVDDQGDPNQALTQLKSALDSSTTPDAVYAGLTGNETLAMLPTLTARKVMAVTITNTSSVDDPSKFPYVFSPTPTLPVYAPILAAQLKDKAYKKVAFATSDEAAAQASSAAEQSAVKAVGLDTDVVTFSATSLDDSAAAGKVQQYAPDVVVLATSNPAAEAHFLQGAAKAGLKTPIVGDYTVNGDLYKTVGVDATANLWISGFASNFEATGSRQEVTDFIGQLKQAVSPLPETDGTAFYLPHDAVRLLQVAARQAHSTAPDAMKHALETMGNISASSDNGLVALSNYKFSATSHMNSGATKADFAFEQIGPLHDLRYGPRP